MTRRALHACMAVALAAGGEASGAEALGVLAVAPPPGPGAEVVELAVRLQQRVAERSAGVLDARQLRERMTGPATGPSLPELERASEAARLAYLHGEYARSLAILRDVAAELERLPDGAEAFERWTRVMLRLARTELDLGHLESARANIERVVRADPEVVVRGSLHPARLVEEIERARAALRATPTAELVIGSSPPGARAYVNGRAVGTAPVRLAVAPGRYRVSGANGSTRVGPLMVDVEPQGREIQLDFEIPDALRPALGPGLALPAGDRARQIVAAGGHLGLDRVVAVTTVEEGGVAFVAAALFDVHRGALEREGRVRLTNHMLPDGADAALAEFLATGRATSGLVEVSRSVRAAPRAPAPRPGPGVPAPVLPANERRGRGSLAVRLGYARGMGNIGDTTAMDEWIDAQLPVQADVLLRVGPRLSLGAYASYGFGQGGGDVAAICRGVGVTCSLAVLRAGVQAEWDFPRGAMAPWMAAGLGYEWNVFRAESQAGSTRITYTGIELLGVQGGGDWTVAPGLSLGPFLMATVGWYERGALGGGTLETIHLWLQVGVRSRLDF